MSELSHIAERNQEEQQWEQTLTNLAGLSVSIRTPINMVLNENGVLNTAAFSLSYENGDMILANQDLPIADISNALVKSYQHIALGGVTESNIHRGDALEHIQAAMKLINASGANAIVSNTRDQGQFEHAGNTVMWHRLVSGSQVITNFNTTTVQSEDDSIQQGVWLTLRTNINNVATPLEQYTAYAKTYMGEE
jgi:hypothetical protein